MIVYDHIPFGSLASESVERQQIPAGSIVPLLQKRKMTYRVPTAAQMASIAAARRATISKLAYVRTVSSRQFVSAVTPVRTTLTGFGAFGSTQEQTRNLVSLLEGALSEIEGLQITDPEQGALGSHMIMSRAGDISAALGIPVTWEDLTDNCSQEFARLYNGIADNAGGFLSEVSFDHLAAMFRGQGQPVAALRDLAASARSLYTTSGIPDVSAIVADAAAYCEGGLRRTIIDLMGSSATAGTSWLTSDNLRAAANVAQAWVGAATSGRASGYVKAVGSTVSAAGGALSVIQPAGAIVSAVGGFISLIGGLFGNEPPPPPEVFGCTDVFSSSVIGSNPEAWTALAVWLCCKDADPDNSMYYKDAARRGILVQQAIAEDGWSASIDRYTGEVMASKRGVTPGNQPKQRLLDLIERDKLIPSSDPLSNLRWLNRKEVALQFGMWPRSPLLKNQKGEGVNILWCAPSPSDTFTSFINSRREPNEVMPFRIPSATPDHTMSITNWDWIGKNEFWSTYRTALVVSMYLGGTVPYGVGRHSLRPRALVKDASANLSRESDGHGFCISTGVGGLGGTKLPIALLESGNDPYDLLLPCDRRLTRKNATTDGARIRVTMLPQLMENEAWRIEDCIPRQTPLIQTAPARQLMVFDPRKVGRPATNWVANIDPDLLARIQNAVDKSAGDGMSTGAKVALGVGAVGLLGLLYWKFGR